MAIFLLGNVVTGFYFQSKSNPHLSVSGFPVLKQKGYTIAYDGRSKVPLWTYERLTQKQLVQNAHRKKSHFCEDQKLYPLHRSTLTDYYHSGYDRGHMVPARDQQVSQEQLNQTFLLSNICPQHPELNRGFWKKLEEHARRQVQGNKSVEVISGPLYLPTQVGESKFVTYPVIGQNNVAVPTHFYKIIRVNSITKESNITAYIVPNSPVSAQSSLQEYEVPLTEVEKATGLVFEVSSRSKKSLAALIDDSI